VAGWSPCTAGPLEAQDWPADFETVGPVFCPDRCVGRPKGISRGVDRPRRREGGEVGI
jgi:hypothetical protein